MYAVIGTAGHVDHGKSSLIQALTGTHPSHLPMELVRGMTIDLGFACLQSAEGDEIGLIDVPGHERFLHNMLSSLWGLDCVLFVVAADEGWSSLSEEHLRVISAVGIRRIIVALTKCDLADPLQLDGVEEEILERFLSVCNMLPDICRVSARTGTGIENLREALLHLLRNSPAPEPLSAVPHLYIDRIFSINGIGTTVTGTLRGGRVSIGDVMCLYPGEQKVKVKSIQSYHHSRDQAQSCSRVAMSFRQLKKDTVSRGDCLAPPGAEITASREWIVQLKAEVHPLKKQCALEVALGTSHTHARCYLLGGGHLARLQLARPLPAFWGQTVLLMMPGGNRLVASGRVVWMGPLGREQRPRLIGALQDACDGNLPLLRNKVMLAVNGYVRQSDHCPFPMCRGLKGWWVTEQYYNHCVNRIVEILSKATFLLGEEELSARTLIPKSILHEILTEQSTTAIVQVSAEGVRLAGTNFSQLTAQQRALFSEINDAGRACFSAHDEHRPGLKSQLKSLVERKCIVPMDDRLFISADHYESLLADILRHCQAGDLLSIADVREYTGLARKQLIPLLNRMERDGWLRREGNLRRVKKIVVMR